MIFNSELCALLLDQFLEPKILIAVDSPIFTTLAVNHQHHLKNKSYPIDLLGKSTWAVFSDDSNEAGHLIKKALDSALFTQKKVKVPLLNYPINSLKGKKLKNDSWDLEFSPMIGENGKIEYILGTIHNVTKSLSRNLVPNEDPLEIEWKGKEQALTKKYKTLIREQVNLRKNLEKSESLLRMATEAAEIGIWQTNPQKKYLTVSPRTKEIFGFNPDDEITLEESMLKIDDSFQEKVWKAIELALKKKDSFLIEYPLKSINDKITWIRSMGKINQKSKGGKYNFSGVLMDITREKLKEIQLHDFIGMVSHELKTPLTALKGIIQLVLLNAHKEQDTSMINLLERADNKTNKINSIINGFLNTSIFETGQIQLNPAPFNLLHLMEEIIGELSLMHPDCQVSIQNNHDITIIADHEKVGQVIYNIVMNAIKYSPNSSLIQISYILENSSLRISVKDKGMGIKKEDHPKLFNKFYRSVDATDQNIAGFGIGLYLCSKIVQAHKGKIWAESLGYGEGSTFHFNLPYQASEIN